ncbi:MAG TPA: hypothetical protein VNJ07_05505 [Chitinophagales bacterium]|nr:hypothetical protein [Chitinophagales bacterium]
MKLIACLFAFYVLFLVAQPAIGTMIEKCQTACCSDTCHKSLPADDHPSKDDCSSCNPFLSCCNCAGCPLTFPAFRISRDFAQDLLPIVFSENAVSQFSSDCWHPPKAA